MEQGFRELKSAGKFSLCKIGRLLFPRCQKERFQYHNPWGPGMVYGIHKTKTLFFCIQDLNEDRLIKIYLILVTNSKHIDCMKIV